jgi:nitrate reductase alpha subunit
MWGSNVPLTRTPDAHFMTEVRYKGTKDISVAPDYARVSGTLDPHIIMYDALYQSLDSGTSVCSPQICGEAGGKSAYQS